MKSFVLALIVVACVVGGTVLGWFVGNAMELTGILDPETFWKTDPENVWVWSAIAGGVCGLIVGLFVANRFAGGAGG